MNITIEKYPATGIENKIIEQFDNLELLGIHVYVQMLIQFETTTVCEIIDRIIQKFKVDNETVMLLLKRLEKEGLLTVIKKEN